MELLPENARSHRRENDMPVIDPDFLRPKSKREFLQEWMIANPRWWVDDFVTSYNKLLRDKYGLAGPRPMKAGVPSVIRGEDLQDQSGNWWETYRWA